MATKKTQPLDADTKVRIINNSNSKIHWIQLNGRPITLLKIGTPSTLPFIELENMAYTSDLIQTGDIYVQDKNVYDNLGLNVKYEDIKLHTQLKLMLANLNSEELKEEIEKLPNGNKELLAELAVLGLPGLRSEELRSMERG